MPCKDIFYLQSPFPKASYFSKIVISLLLLLSAGLIAQAQGWQVRGKIYNEKGAPVAFVTVNVKGIKNGITSGEDGSFKINITKIPALLQFAAAGYESTERNFQVKDFKDSIASTTVTIKTTASILNEVVVTAALGVKRNVTNRSVTYASAAPVTLTGKTADGMRAGLKRTARPVNPILKVDEAIGAEAVRDRSPLAYEHLTKPAETDQPKKKKSNLLTAGEVNDFKKWNLWEDYNETDFKIHSEKWNLYATKRYSVQLQNKDFKAVTGQKVYLINRANDDTLWTAVSDNTGKAELWKGFSKNIKENNLVIAVQNEAKQFAAIPFTQGINRVNIDRSCAVSNKIEIAFVVDATGSMQDEIDYLNDELQDILTKFSIKDTSLELHTGAVFYRDKGDEYVTRIQQLSPGIAGTTGFMQNQFAGGGGDYPEAMNEALQDATEKLDWSADARTRIIFLLMDASPHDEAKNEMAALISNAASKGIRIVPVACSGTDKATEFIMRSIALATNGTYLFLTDDSGIGNSHIKPTTDEFKVEPLNDLLIRTIEQMCYVNTCKVKTTRNEPFTAFPNTGKVKLFPNPTTGPVILETNKELKEIYVADFTGKLLMQVNVKDRKGKYPIDLSAFPSATYFIRYVTKDNISGAGKVVLIR